MAQIARNSDGLPILDRETLDAAAELAEEVYAQRQLRYMRTHGHHSYRSAAAEEIIAGLKGEDPGQEALSYRGVSRKMIAEAQEAEERYRAAGRAISYHMAMVSSDGPFRKDPGHYPALEAEHSRAAHMAALSLTSLLRAMTDESLEENTDGQS